jgi:hypothetical protein
MINKHQYKQNARRMSELRRKRDKQGRCRQCGKKAVKSKRTGKLTKACADHLAADSARKDVERIVELPWDSKPAKPCRNGGSTANDIELRWMKG